MTVADFVRWDDGTETRYELVHGNAVAMAPPSGRHAEIVGNLGAAIGRQLQRPCRIPQGGGVARGENDEDFRLPDVFVSCEPTPPVYFREPALVVEVLSPSTEKEDRTEKLDFYKSLASVRAILLVWQDKRRVQVLERDDARWIDRDLIGGGFELAGLELALTLDEIYTGVELPAEAADA